MKKFKLIVIFIAVFGVGIFIGNHYQRPIIVEAPQVTIEIPTPEITVTPILDPNILIEIPQQETTVVIGETQFVQRSYVNPDYVFFFNQDGGINLLTREQVAKLSPQMAAILNRLGGISQ